jgi:type I restriction enzyme S subunit
MPTPPIDVQISVNIFLDAAKNKTALPKLPDFMQSISLMVARIEALTARIAEAQSLRREASNEARNILKSAISNTIKPNSRNQKKLDDVCLQITDGEHATPPREETGDIPLATAKNVRDGYLDLKNTDFVSIEVAEKCWKRCKPQENDVLMVCVGATTGRVCRLINPPKIVIVRSVALLRPNPELLNPAYLEYALESSASQIQIWNLVKQAAQPGIYINRMREIVVPIVPLEEQQKIVMYLDELQAKVSELSEVQNASVRELDALLPSILDQAFKGEL